MEEILFHVTQSLEALQVREQFTEVANWCSLLWYVCNVNILVSENGGFN
jgi:hypothetical protein